MASLGQVLRGLFNKKQPAKNSSLKSVADLTVGDFVEFGFVPQTQIAQQRFEVTAVSGYDFDGLPYPSFTLRSTTADNCYLTEHTNGLVALSLELPAHLVKKIIPHATIDNIFAASYTAAITLASSEPLQHWLATSYTKDKEAILGYYQEKYVTGSKLAEAEGFDYYSLLDETGKYMLEIEVYDGGDTEFYATVLHNKSCISSIWPGQGKP